MGNLRNELEEANKQLRNKDLENEDLKRTIKGASHNSVLTIQTVLFSSTIVLRRIQFRVNRQMNGYHYETL